jgi:hypothetical protein
MAKKKKEIEIPEGLSLNKYAEKLLMEIAISAALLKKIDIEMEHELNNIRMKYELNRSQVHARCAAAESNLTELMKQKTQDLFGGLDKLVLKAGILFHSITKKLSFTGKGHQPTIDSIKALGWATPELIHVKESLETEELEKWSDEKLEKIGVSKKDNEDFAYELTVSEAVVSADLSGIPEG